MVLVAGRESCSFIVVFVLFCFLISKPRTQEFSFAITHLRLWHRERIMVLRCLKRVRGGKRQGDVEKQ